MQKPPALIVLPALAASLIACATDPDPALTGEYGGDGIGLIASEAEARWKFRCAAGRTDPLRFGSAVTAHARGHVSFSGAGAQPMDLLVDARRIDAVTLEVSVRFGVDGSPQVFELTRDAEPDVAGGCVAAGDAGGVTRAAMT